MLTKDQKTHLARLIEVLRSGELVQGHRQLLTKMTIGNEIVEKYCCLGVACKIYSQEVGGYWGGPSGAQFIADDARSDIAPDDVAEYFGLRTHRSSTHT